MLVVTHEMRFAREVSSRVFYMDQGEVWEQGPPEQIFGNPQRELTRNFIFRVRSWDWTIDSVDFDYRQMEGSLVEFCTRQFLGRHTTNTVQLLVEELAAQLLVPAARAHGVENPDIRLTLTTGEEGRDAVLDADCRALVAACGEDLLTGEENKMSMDIIHGLADVEFGAEPGLLSLRIKSNR